MIFLLLLAEVSLCIKVGVFLPKKNPPDGLYFYNGTVIEKIISKAACYVNKSVLDGIDEVQLFFREIGNQGEIEDPKLALDALEKFNVDDEVDCLIGPFCQGSYSDEFLSNVKIPLISNSKKDDITLNKFIARISPSSSIIAETLGSHLFSVKVKEFIVIYDKKDNESQSVLDCIKEKMDDFGFYSIKEINWNVTFQKMEYDELVERIIETGMNNILFLPSLQANYQDLNDFFELTKSLQDSGDYFWYLGDEFEKKVTKLEMKKNKNFHGLMYVSNIIGLIQLNTYYMTEVKHIVDDFYKYDLYKGWYDAVIIIGNILRKIIEEKEKKLDFANELMHFSGLGSSGGISIDEMGERNHKIGIKIIQPDSIITLSENALYDVFEWIQENGTSNLTFHGGFKQNLEVLKEAPNFKSMWVSKPRHGSHPSVSVGYCSITYKDNFIVFGGFDGYDTSNDIYFFNLITQKWRKVYPRDGIKPPKVKYHDCVEKNGFMYTFGGRSEEMIMASMWVFDLEYLFWSEISTTQELKPSARFNHNLVLKGDEIFLFGGISERELTSKVWTFDINTYLWNKALFSNSSIAKSRQTTVVNDNGDFFFYGGVDTFEDSIRLYKIVDTNETWTYTAQNKWMNLTSIVGTEVGSRFGHTYTKHKFEGVEWLYVFFGFSFQEGEIKNSIFRLDITDPYQMSEWEEVKFFFDSSTVYSPRTYHSATIFEEEVLFFGGIENFHDKKENHKFDLWHFCMQENTFFQIHDEYPDSPDVSRHISWIFGEDLYIFGGIDSGGISQSQVYQIGLNDFKVFVDTTVTENENGSKEKIHGRSEFCYVHRACSLFFFGGRDESDGLVFNDFWRYSAFLEEFTQIQVSNVVNYNKEKEIEGRYQCSMSIDKTGNDFYIMGGIGEGRQLFNGHYYYYDWTITEWSYLRFNNSSKDKWPIGLIGCFTSVSDDGTSLYSMGCYSLSIVDQYIRKMDLETRNWEEVAYMKGAATRDAFHFQIESHGIFFQFGGQDRDYITTNKLVQVNITSGDVVVRNPGNFNLSPSPIRFSDCVYFKKRLICTGGELASQFYSRSGSPLHIGIANKHFLSSDIWVYYFETTTKIKTELPCSKGTEKKTGEKLCTLCKTIGKLSLGLEESLSIII